MPGKWQFANGMEHWIQTQHLVARCATSRQVSEALRAARDANIAISVHCGGQDWTGRSLRDGSLVIDLSGMTGLSIDGGHREAVIEGGVTTGQLNQAAAEHGLAAVIGNDGSVGRQLHHYGSTSCQRSF